ncbi:MAG: pilus assembly protein PilM [Synergistaceae bacterium]|nr:pilus assembly protein PilM [Synergistaceae bacterium]
MALFSRKKKIKAGLILDSGLWRYIALEGAPGHCRVVSHISGSLSSGQISDDDPFAKGGALLGSAFREVAEQIDDKSIPICLSLPTNEALLRIVNMPGMTLPEAKMAMKYEFENYFPFSVDDGIYDMAELDYPMPNGAEEKRFLVAAARLSLIDNIMKFASDAGFLLDAIEPAQIAAERAMTPVIPIDDACVYLYVGAFRSILILSWKGKGVFYRNMSIGFDNPSVVVEAEADDQLVAFVKEVRSSLQFALSQIRGFDPKSIYISGPGVSESLVPLLKEALTVENLSLVDPFDLHGIELDTEDKYWNIPLGLALRR